MNVNNPLKDFLAQNPVFFKDKKVLLAVSGGIDSMVMLYAFHSLQYYIGVAHCNFKLRGSESDQDEQLVKQFCQTNNIPFLSISFNTAEIAKKQKTSTQETARTLRYNWFEQLRKKHHFDFIATAHHQDDNAETILFNLIRGTGILGMCGIPQKNLPIIRPLLDVSKKQLEEYALANQVPFRTDASNGEHKYARNKIRNKIFPLLESINKGSSHHINEFGNYSKFIFRILQKRLREIESQILIFQDDAIHLETHELIKDEDAYYFLFEILKKYGFNNAQVKSIEQSILLNSSGKSFTTETHKLVINRSECIITPISHDTDILPELLISKNQLPIKVTISNTTIELCLISTNNIELNNPRKQFLDAEKIADSFTIRQWKAADFFIPLGMKGRKKISDLLIDSKVSMPAKEQTFIISNHGEIAAVIAYQISNLYKIKTTTKTALQISIQ